MLKSVCIKTVARAYTNQVLNPYYLQKNVVKQTWAQIGSIDEKIRGQNLTLLSL
jgi:hypothetical protein